MKLPHCLKFRVIAGNKQGAGKPVKINIRLIIKPVKTVQRRPHRCRVLTAVIIKFLRNIKSLFPVFSQTAASGNLSSERPFRLHALLHIGRHPRKQPVNLLCAFSQGLPYALIGFQRVKTLDIGAVIIFLKDNQITGVPAAEQRLFPMLVL